MSDIDSPTANASWSPVYFDKVIDDVFKSIRDGLSYEGKLYAVCVAVLWRELDADVTEGLDGRKGYRNRQGCSRSLSAIRAW